MSKEDKRSWLSQTSGSLAEGAVPLLSGLRFFTLPTEEDAEDVALVTEGLLCGEWNFDFELSEEAFWALASLFMTSEERREAGYEWFVEPARWEDDGGAVLW